MISTAESLRRRVALGSLAILLALLGARAAQRPGVDLAVFWRAGRRFLAGADLYGAPGEMPYRYAPGVAALFAPLSALPFAAARALWAALQAALAFAVALALERGVGRRAALAVPLAWALLAQPLAQELSYGQVDLVVLALALAAFALEDRGREASAGALVALAAALKVAPAVLALEWIARRRARPFLGAAAAALALALATAAAYGVRGALEEHARWYATQSADVGWMIAAVRNESLWGMARSLGLGAAGGALGSAALLALALSAPAADRRRRHALLASVPLVSAYGWPQLFVLAMPLLADALAGGGATAWVAGAAAAGISGLGYDVAGARVEAWALGHRVLGVLLLAVVIAGRFTSRAASPRRTCSS